MNDLFHSGPQRHDDGTIKDDAHWTPQLCADACVTDLARLIDPRSIREPSAGGGAFVRSSGARWPSATIEAIDIWPGAPGLQEADVCRVGNFNALEGVGHVDLTLGNPPFGGPDGRRGRAPGDPRYAGAHHALRAVLTSTVVGMILPWEWMAVGYVQDLLWSTQPPTYVRPIRPRAFPRIKACGWYVWDARQDSAFKVEAPLMWRESRFLEVA